MIITLYFKLEIVKLFSDSTYHLHASTISNVWKRLARNINFCDVPKW